MNLAFRVSIFGLFFFLCSVGSGIAEEEQGVETQAQTSSGEVMSTAPIPLISESAQVPFSNENLVAELNLRAFVGAKDLELCGGDKRCLKYAERVKTWLCMAQVCKEEDTIKRPLDCSKSAGELSAEAQAQYNASICPVLEAPSTETRRALLRHASDTSEDKMIENTAYTTTLDGSSEACTETIKNHVGPYGPQWTYVWYRAVSGCRILSGERTREQEEKDILTWLEVIDGKGSCEDIENSEMRSACNTPGAASPQPVHDGE